MMVTNRDDIVSCAVTVQLPVVSAFELFVHQFGSWWPAEYTWSRDVLETIAIDGRLGGRCFERGPHGFTCDWGRVLTWQPPHRVHFSWQISPRREPEPNPAKASEVDIRFTEVEPSTTRVDLHHIAFARHGDGAESYRAALASPQGWPWILDQYRGAAQEARARIR